MKIEEFVMYMDRSEKSNKTARYYLSMHDWNVEKAVQDYRADLEWEKNNKITSVPLANFNPLHAIKKK